MAGGGVSLRRPERLAPLVLTFDVPADHRKFFVRRFLTIRVYNQIIDNPEQSWAHKIDVQNDSRAGQFENPLMSYLQL